MSGRVLVLSIIGAGVAAFAWFLWRGFLSPLFGQDPPFHKSDGQAAERTGLAIVPTIPTSIPEDQVPKIPSYLVGPFVFIDARLGVAMLAGWPVLAGVRTEVDPWIFRVHGDHWCTVRKATINDLETIENLRRYSRPLLLLRAQ